MKKTEQKSRDNIVYIQVVQNKGQAQTSQKPIELRRKVSAKVSPILRGNLEVIWKKKFKGSKHG